MIEIRDVQVFRAVMQAGSASKAASMLGISQPAVSQAIRKLEASSELRLFDRVRGRLSPTPEARSLMIEVDRCFTGLEMIEHRIRSLRAFGLGRLVVASHPALGIGFMPRAIARLDPVKRRLQMSFQILSSRDVFRDVAAGQLDFGLMADEIPVGSLEHSEFVKTSAVVVMPSGHALAARTACTAADLAAHPFLALNTEDSSRRKLEAAVREHGHELSPVIETPYSHTICELALAGVGIGVAHPLQALEYVSQGLIVRPIELDVQFRSLLVFRPGIPMAENAKTLLQKMRMQLSADLNAVERVMGRPFPKIAVNP